MVYYNPVTNQRGECLPVGRGAIAIYLALSTITKKNGKVVVPANICYAAIFPVLYAGLAPVFCDVDSLTGNVFLDDVVNSYSEEVVAAIIPHMYGNPVSDFPLIAQYCKERNIILIEDCASLMGGNAENYMLGTMGDYVVYSTGYSKTIDIGYGGLLFSSKYSLSKLEKLESKLPNYKERYAEEWSIFSKIYRVIRNEGENALISKAFYSILPDTCKELFLYNISDKKKQAIVDSIDKLDDVIAGRRHAYQIYNKKLENIKIQHYNYNLGAVPWRYNIFVDKEKRQDFILHCLNKKLPVSDWYPCVTSMFGIDKKFPNALWHEQHIVNFPLLITEGEIQSVCDAIKDYYERWM